MIDRNTPPASPEMEEEMDEEDMVYIGDVDEVIEALDNEAVETLENEGNVEEEAMDEDVSDNEEAVAVNVFTGHKVGSVFCGSLSKNGKLAATGGEEDKAYVWDVATGDIVLECTGHKDSVIFAEFNFDESYLVTGDMSGIIQAWKMSDKSCVWEYNIGDTTWIKWHFSANVLFAGVVEGEVYMWKIPDGDCKVFQGYGCRAEAATILPDGKHITVGYENGTIRTLDLKTSAVVSIIPPNQGHSATITALDSHSNNSLILSAAVDGKTILSMPHTGKIISVLQVLDNGKQNNAGNSSEVEEGGSGDVASNWVETAVFCKDPTFQIAATGTLNGEIFIWDISKQILRQKIDQKSGISKLLWKGATSLLFSAGLDGILRCFDARHACGRCMRSFIGHTADILDLYISKDEKIALTASDDSTARIFDISTLH